MARTLLEPCVKGAFPTRQQRHPWRAEPRPSLERQHYGSYLTWGGACIALATYLPWVIARFEEGWWSWTGMQLTYAHVPPFTIGYISLVLGGSSILLGQAEARRPGYAELAILPAGLTAFFLWFINSSLHGHFGEQIEAYKGFSAAWLGPGYWLMMIGTGLVVVGIARAVSTTPGDGSISLVSVEAKLPSRDVATRDEHCTDAVHKQFEHSSSGSPSSRTPSAAPPG
jgi:hypothetical protein